MVKRNRFVVAYGRHDSEIVLRVCLAHRGVVKFALDSYVVPAVGNGFENVMTNAKRRNGGVSERVCRLGNARASLGAL